MDGERSNYSAPAETVAFVTSLAARFPGLRPLLDEHRRDNFGKVLPHIIFYDVTQYVLSRFADGSVAARGEVRDILDVLEEAFSTGHEYVRGLISVSFLENLPSPWEPQATIRDLVGPKMREELRSKLLGPAS